MSLKIWLPLTKDLRNLGASSLTSVTVPSCATIDNTGKIGKCYTSSGTANGAVTMLDFTASKFSIAAWVRINTRVNAWRCPFKLVNSSAAVDYSYIGFCCEHNTLASYVGFHFYKTIDGTNTAIFDAYPITNMTIGVWTHLAVAYDGKTVTYYKDGALVSSATIAAAKLNTVANMDRIIMFGSDGSRGAAAIKSSLNDVRIYDHCLSPEEVRELANGLVLHYKLDASNENLLKDVPKKYVPTDYDGYLLSLKLNLTAGQAYTLQLWDVLVEHSAKTAAQMNLAVYWGGGNVLLIHFNLNAFDETRDHYAYASYLSITFTPTSTLASGSGATNAWFNLYNSVGNASGTRNMKIGAWKLEKGSEATPWISSDGDLATVVDSSGYNNNTEDISNINTTSDTNRYLSAFTCSELYYDALRGRDFNNTTFNIWFKLSTSSSYPNIMFGNVNIALWPPNKYIVRDWTLDSFEHNKKFNTNEWYMLTIIFTSRTITTYINAQLIALDTFSGDLSFSGPVGIDNMNNIYISDIRFYATPLLDSEIKKLYNISMGMDNKNLIHTYEFNEFAPPSLSKTGILGGLLNEVDECSHISLLNNTNWLVNGAIER